MLKQRKRLRLNNEYISNQKEEKMKIINAIRMALNSMSTRIWSCLGTLIMLVICLSLFSFSVLFYQSSRYNRLSCKGVFSEGIDKTGMIRQVNDVDHEVWEEFYHRLKKLETISVVGESTNLGNDLPQELMDIQKGHQQTYLYAIDNSLEMTIVDKDMFDLCPLQVESGIKPSEYKNQEGKRGIYLGAAFRDVVSVGDCFQSGDVNYQVAGILEPGQKWLMDDLNCGNVSDVSNLVSTDYMIFDIKPVEVAICSSMCFSVAPEFSFDVTAAQIRKLAADYGIDLSVTSIDGMIRGQEVKNQALTENVRQLFFMVFIVTIIIMCCQQIVLYISNRREYGVLYAVGMSGRAISVLLLIENSIKIGLALGITVGVVNLRTRFIYGDSGRWDVMRDMMQELVYHYTLPYTVLMAMGVFLIATGVPLLIFYHLSPVELIGGKE